MRKGAGRDGEAILWVLGLLVDDLVLFDGNAGGGKGGESDCDELKEAMHNVWINGWNREGEL